MGSPESKTQLTPQTLDEIFPGDESGSPMAVRPDI